MKLLQTLTLPFLIAGAACAANASKPFGEPVLEPPTLHCLSVYWIIQGDDNKNAKVELEYRETSPKRPQAWRQGMNLFRVEKGGNRLEHGRSLVKVPDDAWLFAGSAMRLQPGTEYELRLTLSDPDGTPVQRTLTARTLAEPRCLSEDAADVRSTAFRRNPAEKPPEGGTTNRFLHVVPGNGGGTGTKADPFRGLEDAQAAAKPGSLFLLHAGTYPGTFEVRRSGEPGRPIIWRAAGDGEAIIDGQGGDKRPPERAVSASDTHDVWFEGLTIRRAVWGLVAHMSQRLVVRRCHFYDVKRGLTAVRNTDGRHGGLFIADNLLEGPFAWSAPEHGADVEENRGIEISGSGNVVCYNRVRGFKDGIDMHPSPCCVASDIHNNEVSECLDDGCEMDGSERNCRCYLNRFANCFQGISVQPVYGGPIYVFRNALYNLEVETFKMHNSPSGAIFYHNTSVKKGVPLVLSTSEKVRNCVYRNNLFIGTVGNYAYETTAPMRECDFDYDGFGGGPWGNFLKWNGVRYKTLADVRARAPVYRHAVAVDPGTLFATGIRPPGDTKHQYDPREVDLRLRAGTAAVGAGEILPGLNDDVAGKRPDLGAYEQGDPLPHYGPR